MGKHQSRQTLIENRFLKWFSRQNGFDLVPFHPNKKTLSRNAFTGHFVSGRFLRVEKNLVFASCQFGLTGRSSLHKAIYLEWNVSKLIRGSSQQLGLEKELENKMSKIKTSAEKEKMSFRPFQMTGFA